MTDTDASPRRTRAKRGDGEKLYEQILDVADRLLLETGDEEAVSIRAVADAAGITPPSIYLHFKDKNELLFAVCEKHFARFDEMMEQAGSTSDDPLESLILRGHAYVRFGLENPEHYRIMFMRKPENTAAGFQDEMLRRMAAFDHLVASVHRCVEARLLQGDPLELSLALWAGMHGITSLLLSKPDFPWPDRERIVDRVLQILVRGARTTP